MRCLLIGASGQLGLALHAAFASDYEVIAAAYRHVRPGQVVLDLADRVQVRAVLEETTSDIIVIAGAMCAVDRCEQEPDTCRRINVSGTQAIGDYAANSGGRVVYFSTDHVFDGTQESYVESDPIRPLNVYAASKAEGEAVLRKLIPDRHLIIRTSWVYGPDLQRRNFALRCVDLMRKGEPVLVPADQWGSPTYTEDLAAATRFLVDRGLNGTFHATGPEWIDRVSLARKICTHFGLECRSIVPKPTSELGQAARRPLRVRLDCQKLRLAGAGDFCTIDAGLDRLARSEVMNVSR